MCFICWTGVDFSFANYYGDSMVLQRSPSNAVIWGYSLKVGDVVTVTIEVDGKMREYETTSIDGRHEVSAAVH